VLNQVVDIQGDLYSYYLFSFSFKNLKFFIPTTSLPCREKCGDFVGNVQCSPADVKKTAAYNADPSVCVCMINKESTCSYHCASKA
jgi:hypothetical protein